MNNPIKIIHKFKNNNRRIQYIQYIFIGSLVDDKVYNILKTIKNKNLYDTLDFLNKNKLKILEIIMVIFGIHIFLIRITSKHRKILF